ncbi:hypothetical protein CLV62_112121 [Dysgonomonas alginatilytica]|uniref:Uncharacterized protein n=1 Tax=Dysgonomonas alginatilytica TaxID=1605892 RepID=A0A2V3PQK2_9BACT|nr:hypothetical protein [Dysgonomonas alginatilytica]PXV63871.1 hypothetical protein CLV62_112121 [Dysgonomonas alginatilytica]
MKLNKYLVLIILLALVIGFFIGPTIKTDKDVKYVKGETVTASIDTSKFELLKEEKPNIQYRDTGSIKYRYAPVDTAAIIADYELKRSYKVIAFDDKAKGKLELFPVIQYNKLAGLDYNFTPIQKEISIQKKQIWMPYASMSYSTLNYIGIGGGIFYHDIGLELRYVTDFNKKGVDIGLKYKF